MPDSIACNRHGFVRRIALVLPGLWASQLACLDLPSSPGTTRANRGFFDLGIEIAPPDGASELCYALRVRNEVGEVVDANEQVCSGGFGNDAGGDISYVVTCDADSPVNTVTVWIHAPEGASTWDNPCPAPRGAESPVDTWSGGCERRMTCLENEDVAVDFSFTPDPSTR